MQYLESYMAVGLESQGQLMAATGDSLMSVVRALFAPCWKDNIIHTSNIDIFQKSYMRGEKVVLLANNGVYMGGLALMVISPKNWEFSPFCVSTFGIIQPHLKSFTDFI